VKTGFSVWYNSQRLRRFNQETGKGGFVFYEFVASIENFLKQNMKIKAIFLNRKHIFSSK
jgi:hypothetical protein